LKESRALSTQTGRELPGWLTPDVQFLTVGEVAVILRVSKMTVYRLLKSGELESIRVGRSFRVPEQAVNQYLQAAFVGGRM
jgi:excisionase family DNA binding protein